MISTLAGEFYWQKVKTSGISPAPRWHHTVAVKAPSTLVLFGGFRSSSVRFNDLWLLDTKSDKWSQPPPGATEESEDGKILVSQRRTRCPGVQQFHDSIADVVGPDLQATLVDPKQMLLSILSDVDGGARGGAECNRALHICTP